MRVLIACEESGRSRDAFIKRGHDAISCDLLPTRSRGPHHQGDVYEILFTEYWDLIIAHPECTYLTVAGNKHYGRGKEKHHKRIEAAKWTEQFWNDCKSVSDRVCFENPVSTLASMTNLPKPVYIQPYQFGHLEQKKTGLYLHNLPPLETTDDVYEQMMLLPKNHREKVSYMPPSDTRSRDRSETYQGIADAFADQWGIY